MSIEITIGDGDRIEFALKAFRRKVQKSGVLRELKERRHYLKPSVAKKLKEALQQMSEEGVVQVFRPRDGAPALVGVVGQLQLDVLKARLDAEYSLPVEFEQSEFQLARWISCDDAKKLDAFIGANGSGVADDVDGDPVFLARNQFYLDYTRERSEGIAFTNVKDVKKTA
jgi:peptide chain release factor 3